jgi:hypothetical protein
LREYQRQGRELEKLMKEIKGQVDVEVEEAGGSFGAPKVDKDASSKGST